MKVLILTLTIFLLMLFQAFSQENSKLSKVLNSWKKNPNAELSDQLSKAAIKEVKYEYEAKLICSSLEIIRDKAGNSFDEKTEDNLYSLTSLFQDVSTKESANFLNDHGIHILIEILDIIHSKKYELKSYGSTEMMILKMFAIYKNEKALAKLSECINADFKADEYLWNIILSELVENEEKYQLIIDKLNGKIPPDFLGISYLDMCNSIALKNHHFVHPFNTQKGLEYLQNIVFNSDEKNESYVISATVSIPFLDAQFQEKLLEYVSNHKSVDVRVEAAWAGAKLRKQTYVDKLISFCKDYRYSHKSVQYVKELGMEAKLPAEVNDPDFVALSEMCNWLSHPNEFGSYPDNAEIYDKREIFWPPTKDKRILYLIKYRYKNHNEDGSDEIGIGMVGSVTFSLFGLEKVNEMRPLEIYAIHCNWEMEKNNYTDVKAGIDLLKKYNKGL